MRWPWLRDGLDIWLYFLRNAEKMDKEALPQILREPLVERAMEELQVLTQTELERERYESRRKAQLDENTRNRVARVEGREEGREEGRLEGERIATIRIYEQLLGRPVTPREDLARRSLEELTRMADELQRLVANR